MPVRKLPTFKGYTVDVRLKEFRRLKLGEAAQFIDFESERGDQLLADWLESDPNALDELTQG